MSHDIDELVAQACRRAASIPGDVSAVVTAQIDDIAPLLTPEDRHRAVSRAIARLDGLDVLDEYLVDDEVDEVMVNRGREVWIDRGGSLEQVASLPDGAAEVIVERVLAPLGKRLDRTTPIVDARLPGGARLCAVVAPVAIDGTSLSIRRHRPRTVPVADFASPAVLQLVHRLVRSRANLLITGATSSGKTTLLAGLLGLADPGDRLVVVEDTAELLLADRHAVRLESRPAGVDGVAAVELGELVRTALRLRPDRLVVGEFRGTEVVAVVQALNTGHDGSLSTCHANGALDGLRRVETLVMQASPSWPLPAIRRYVSRSIDVVIHLGRAPDGCRRIVEIVEVIETADEPDGRPLASNDVVVADLTRGRR